MAVARVLHWRLAVPRPQPIPHSPLVTLLLLVARDDIVFTRAVDEPDAFQDAALWPLQEEGYDVLWVWHRAVKGLEGGPAAAGPPGAEAAAGYRRAVASTLWSKNNELQRQTVRALLALLLEVRASLPFLW